MTQEAKPPTSAALTLEQISSTAWRFSRASGTHAVEPIYLLADGTIRGHSNKNEARWTLDQGFIAFVSETGEISTRFDSFEQNDDGFRLAGPYLLNPKMQLNHVLEPIEFGWETRKRPGGLTRTALGKDIKKYEWTVGDHTIGKPTVRNPTKSGLRIGKFCSIGNDVTFILSGVRTTNVTTYPFNSLRAHWPTGRHASSERDKNGSVTIGSDVWIGEKAVVGPGVTIGDGAVISAGAIVTTDVSPYTIVAGAPAQETGRRFSATQIQSLLSIRWWDWPDEQIDAFLPIMAQGVDAFAEAALRE